MPENFKRLRQAESVESARQVVIAAAEDIYSDFTEQEIETQTASVRHTWYAVHNLHRIQARGGE